MNTIKVGGEEVDEYKNGDLEQTLREVSPDGKSVSKSIIGDKGG